MTQRIQALDVVGKTQQHDALPGNLAGHPRLMALACSTRIVMKGGRAGPPCIFALVVRDIGNAAALLHPVDLFGKVVELLEDAPRSRLVCGVIGLDDIRWRGRFRGLICMFLVAALNMRTAASFGHILQVVNQVYGGSFVLSLDGRSPLVNLHLVTRRVVRVLHDQRQGVVLAPVDAQ